jgi:hypothetical protein
MVSPVAAPSPNDREFPKSAPLKTSSTDRGDAAARTDVTALGYFHEHDEVEMRLTTKDGDVLEVRGTFDFEAAYAAKYTGVKPAGKKAGGDATLAAGEGAQADGAEAETDGMSDIAKWAHEVERELRKQQKKLLEEAMKNFKPVDAGEGRYVMVVGMLYASQETPGGAKAKKADDAGAAPVPEYWNAENTANRIVSFATAFAAQHGKDPEEFAKTIKQAVLEGFNQAHGMTGDLPGAAGKLYQDTKEKVFGKLDKWLEDWKAAGYNQGARLSENSSEPAQAA